MNVQLNMFREIAFNVSGIEHQPHSLRLIWGRQQFKGVLENMTVSYTMFSPGGHPLRASVQASFIGSQKPGLSLAEAAFESPDMSHSRTAKEGLRLYQMSQDIYNDPKYYMQLAKHNDLNQFRKLKPGIQLDFPPLNSSS